MKGNQSHEAALQQLIQGFQEANQAIVESALAVQERNMLFAQSLYSDWFSVLQDHTQNHQTLMLEMEQQIQKQQDAYRKMVQESVARYFDSLIAGFAFFVPTLRLTEKLQICLLAFASRYPNHSVIMNEEILGLQTLGTAEWKAAALIELLEHTSPQLLQEKARLEVTDQQKGIYLLERSEEVPAFWIYCDEIGEKLPAYREGMATSQEVRTHKGDKAHRGHVPAGKLHEVVR
jgi:hypothetical protein